MILAQNPTQTLLLMLLGMLCWGLWAGIYKLTGKWRYELFYFDVAIGVLAAAVVYAYTTGSLFYDGFSFEDDLMHAGKQQWLMAFAAGAIFNLANMILMGGAVVAGLSVAMPLGLGVGLMIGIGMKLIVAHPGHTLFLFGGTASLLVAVVIMAVAYSYYVSARLEQLVREGKVQTTGSIPGHPKGMIVSTNAPSSAKGLLLSIVAGLLFWLMFPLIAKAKAGDFGMGPYSLMVMFASGLMFSTFVYDLFFVNLPVQGAPIDVLAYFQGRLKPHLAGFAAGAVLCTGILAYLAAEAGPAEAQISPLTSYAVQQGAVLVAAVLGLFWWKDFRDAEPRIRAMVWAFLLLFAAGIAAIAGAAKFFGNA